MSFAAAYSRVLRYGADTTGDLLKEAATDPNHLLPGATLRQVAADALGEAGRTEEENYARSRLPVTVRHGSGGPVLSPHDSLGRVPTEYSVYRASGNGRLRRVDSHADLVTAAQARDEHSRQYPSSHFHIAARYGDGSLRGINDTGNEYSMHMLPDMTVVEDDGDYGTLHKAGQVVNSSERLFDLALLSAHNDSRHLKPEQADGGRQLLSEAARTRLLQPLHQLADLLDEHAGRGSGKLRERLELIEHKRR